jgi:hypothetical protein
VAFRVDYHNFHETQLALTHGELTNSIKTSRLAIEIEYSTQCLFCKANMVEEIMHPCNLTRGADYPRKLITM